jgi:hypothetical protein
MTPEPGWDAPALATTPEKSPGSDLIRVTSRVPHTSTPSVPSGTAYLVAPAGVFHRRGPLRVESGFTGDDRVRNLLTVRVEERVLPAVVRPRLTSKLTLTRAMLGHLHPGGSTR